MKMYITTNGNLDLREQTDPIPGGDYPSSDDEIRRERRNNIMYFTILAIANAWVIACNVAMIYFIIKFFR